MKRPRSPARRPPPADTRDVAALEQRIAALEDELARRSRAVAARDASIARLRVELAQRDDALRGGGRPRGAAPGRPAGTTPDGAAPGSAVRAAAAAMRGLLRLLTSRRRRLEASGLFDAGWYLARYPDVARARMDPLDHYLAYGAAEGRDPGPRFDTRFYLATYPDVATRGANPLVDHVERGAVLGRRTRAEDAETH